MIDKHTVESIVLPFMAEHYPEHYLVDLSVHPGGRILVEIGSDQGVGIDECVRITKHIEGQLDRDVEDFELEVGSAGLTAPFKVLRQYQAALGSEVEVLRRGGIKEKGTLTMAQQDSIQLTVVRRVKPEGAKRKVDVEESIQIPMDEVLQCKRIITI